MTTPHDGSIGDMEREIRELHEEVWRLHRIEKAYLSNGAELDESSAECSRWLYSARNICDELAIEKPNEWRRTFSDQEKYQDAVLAKFKELEDENARLLAITGQDEARASRYEAALDRAEMDSETALSRVRVMEAKHARLVDAAKNALRCFLDGDLTGFRDLERVVRDE